MWAKFGQARNKTDVLLKKTQIETLFLYRLEDEEEGDILGENLMCIIPLPINKI